MAGGSMPGESVDPSRSPVGAAPKAVAEEGNNKAPLPPSKYDCQPLLGEAEALVLYVVEHRGILGGWDIGATNQLRWIVS